ncbi:MAG: hypothetical protein PF569_02955 [Candidatus Woesearchaeota archaeon]|nr:hypothetical protein [Candidatus Woesearchaeota archaeon]
MKLNELIIATCACLSIVTYSCAESKKYEFDDLNKINNYSKNLFVDHYDPYFYEEQFFQISDEEREDLSKEALKLNGKIIQKQITTNIKKYLSYYPKLRRVIKKGEKLRDKINDPDFEITEDKNKEWYSIRGGRKLVFEGLMPGGEIEIRGEIFSIDIGTITPRFIYKDSRLKYNKKISDFCELRGEVYEDGKMEAILALAGKFDEEIIWGKMKKFKQYIQQK